MTRVIRDLLDCGQEIDGPDRWSLIDLEFFAGPMERSASPTLSGPPTPPQGFLRASACFSLQPTSVEMIESFYGKKRMRDPKMATEVTKFRGR